MVLLVPSLLTVVGGKVASGRGDGVAGAVIADGGRLKEELLLNRYHRLRLLHRNNRLNHYDFGIDHTGFGGGHSILFDFFIPAVAIKPI
ncbi:hypothetical protein MASR2M15_29860 [Anaerolineales bacterium]